MKHPGAKWLLPVFLSIASFICDFCSKNWANANLQYGQSQIFIPGFMRFSLTRNTGGAFGIGRGHGLLMTMLALAIVSGICIWMWKRERSDSPPNIFERSGIGIIIGGALGNLYDRLTRGEVTDFLDFAFINFPVFNAADALIDIGAVLVVIGALVLNKDKEESQISQNSQE